MLGHDMPLALVESRYTRNLDSAERIVSGLMLDAAVYRAITAGATKERFLQLAGESWDRYEESARAKAIVDAWNNPPREMYAAAFGVRSGRGRAAARRRKGSS